MTLFFAPGAGGAAGTNADPIWLGRRQDGFVQQEGSTNLVLVAALPWDIPQHMRFRDSPFEVLEEAPRYYLSTPSLPPLSATMSATVEITGGLTAVLDPVTTGAGPSRTRRGTRKVYLSEPQATAVFHPNALPEELAAHAVKAWQDDEDDETWFLLA